MSVSNAFEIEEKVVKVHGKLRENMGVKGVSDVVTSLLKERRRKLLNEGFWIDAKRVKSFSENDLGEDRSGHLRLDRRHIRN